jgi:hypothetical protein
MRGWRVVVMGVWVGKVMGVCIGGMRRWVGGVAVAMAAMWVGRRVAEVMVCGRRAVMIRVAGAVAVGAVVAVWVGRRTVTVAVWVSIGAVAAVVAVLVWSWPQRQTGRPSSAG